MITPLRLSVIANHARTAKIMLYNEATPAHTFESVREVSVFFFRNQVEFSLTDLQEHSRLFHRWCTRQNLF
jgi:hypothetical protein